jgi:ribosomal RNA-processing protein 1
MPEYRKFGKELASTRVEVRDHAISELTQYLASTELPYIEYVKIWKGLFYCIFQTGIWMADGREYQQNLTDRLVDLLDQASDKFNWLNAFYETMRTEWDGIDIHRVDKYMTLVRAYVLASLDWAQNNLDQWIELLNTLLNRATGKGLGLAIHIADVYIEEMGDVDYDLAMKLVGPFLKMIVSAKLPHIVTGYFRRIMERLAQKYPGNEEFKKFVWEQASTS